VNLSEKEINDLLDSHPVARLATIGPNAKSHQVPIVFARVAGRLWSPVDGKSKSGGELRRLENIRGNSDVSLLLDHYEDSWAELWWIRVDGTARIVTAVSEQDPGVSDVAEALLRKYPQYKKTPMFRDPPTLISIEPVTIVSWRSS
jgi:PPOX class probable F420-dependent enzyme